MEKDNFARLSNFCSFCKYSCSVYYFIAPQHAIETRVAKMAKWQNGKMKINNQLFVCVCVCAPLARIDVSYLFSLLMFLGSLPSIPEWTQQLNRLMSVHCSFRRHSRI